MPKNGSIIFRLDSRLRKRNKPTKRNCSKHFDSGMAIDIRYNPAFYASSGPAETFSLPAAAALGGGAYRVEAFEDEDDETAWGTAELDEETVDSGDSVSSGTAARAVLSAASLSNGDDEDVAAWGTGQLEALDTPLAASLADETDGEPPAWGTGQLDELDASLPSASSFASPNAAAMARRINEERLLQSDDPDTRAFANDLQAILAGKKEHPSTTGSHPASDHPDETEEEAAPASANKAYASSFSHGIFEEMGRNMSLAKTFDLGSYDLSRQFDAYDRQMDSEDSAGRRNARTAQAQSVSPKAEFAEDLAWMSGRRPAAAPARALDTAPAFDLCFDVPLVPQQTGYSCWAAGCSMLVGWRDQMSIDPSEIARATGAWAAYASGLNAEDVSVFPVWGMVPEPAQCYTVQGFYDLLNTYGPLWVASAEPGPHIRVVTGMTGDGSPDGTTLFINDPWETGMATFRLPNAGARYTETYSQFVQKQETLARQESNLRGAIYVAHLQNPRRR